MTWLFELHRTQPVAHSIGVLAIVCVFGMAFGSIKVFGVRLGTAGVLFAGILVGHFLSPVDHATLHFVKEFGLILFVFTIGLQLGPGFFAALQQQGFKMNVLATMIVLLSAIMAPLMGWLGGFDQAAVLGIFSGASTNTPSLGAATQTLSMLPDISPDRLTLPALAYAVTYPAAIIGIIGTLLALKSLFRIDPVREAAEFKERNSTKAEPLVRQTFIVRNENLDGARVDAIPGRVEAGVTVSRIRHGSETFTATDAATIYLGDLISIVGTEGAVDHFGRALGKRVEEDFINSGTDLTFRRVVVTDAKALGLTVGELNLDDRFGVAVTRVTRSDIEMSAVPGTAAEVW